MFAAATYSSSANGGASEEGNAHTTLGYLRIYLKFLNIQIKLNLDINQRSNKGGRLLLTRINVAFNIFLDI